MIILKIIYVEELETGKRIDAYLAGKTELSRVSIQRYIENQKIIFKKKINEKRSLKIKLLIF